MNNSTPWAADTVHLSKDHWHDGGTQKVNDECGCIAIGKSYLSGDDIYPAGIDRDTDESRT